VKFFPIIVVIPVNVLASVHYWRFISWWWTLQFKPLWCDFKFMQPAYLWRDWYYVHTYQ